MNFLSILPFLAFSAIIVVFAIFGQFICQLEYVFKISPSFHRTNIVPKKIAPDWRGEVAGQGRSLDGGGVTKGVKKSTFEIKNLLFPPFLFFPLPQPFAMENACKKLSALMRE